jgi:CyaY protein
MMTETEFEALADEALARIESAVEECGADAALDRKDGGVLEIECADGSKLIINRQRPAREIWVAARSGGFHFRWDGSTWRDSRDGAELYAALSRLLSEHCGEPVRLRP